MSLLLALSGGSPPVAGDSIGAWFEVEEWEDDEEGSWISALLADAFVPEIVAFQAIDDEDAEDELEQSIQATPGLNDFVQAVVEQVEDEDEEVAEPVAQATPGLNDFVTAWHEADDADEDEDAWQAGYLDTPAAAAPEFLVLGFFDVDDEDLDEAEAVFSQVIDSVAAATDFVQALFEIDEDLLEDDTEWGQPQGVVVPPPVSGRVWPAPKMWILLFEDD
jgi:hypothetical protein